jgi:hypothetical protein
LLRDAILEAAGLAGGDGGIVGYLQQQAVQNPEKLLAVARKSHAHANQQGATTAK